MLIALVIIGVWYVAFSTTMYANYGHMYRLRNGRYPVGIDAVRLAAAALMGPFTQLIMAIQIFRNLRRTLSPPIKELNK